MKFRAFLAVLLGLLSLVGVQHHALSAETIRVGATLSLSGEFANLGQEELNGMQMWVGDLNTRGALLGRKVELIHYDDRSSPETSARLYERLITEDKVDLLLGPYSSDITLEASRVTEKHQFPMLATGAAANQIWERGYKYIFGLETPARDYMVPVLESMQQEGMSRIALIYEQADFTREVATGVRNQAADYGLEVVFDEEYDKGNPRFAARTRRMKAARPDVVIGGTYLDDSIQFVKQAKTERLSPQAFVFTVGPAVRDFGDTLGPDAEGIMGVVVWMPGAHFPGARDFSYRYKSKFGHNPGYHAAYGYAGGQVLEAAVRLAGTLEKDKINKQLSTMKFRSVLGHYRVDSTGKQIGKRNYVMQWQDGRRRLILPERIAERPVDFPFKPWSER
jgi:branched-chain amino acid transport system substrate-binding protein